MRIEFDSAKDETNQAKHGVSLLMAVELDWEAALVWVDERFEYNEMRMIARSKYRNPVLRGLCRSWQCAKDHQPSPRQSS